MTRTETQSNAIGQSRVSTLSPARRAQNGIAMGLIGVSALIVLIPLFSILRELLFTTVPSMISTASDTLSTPRTIRSWQRRWIRYWLVRHRKLLQLQLRVARWIMSQLNLQRSQRPITTAFPASCSKIALNVIEPAALVRFH